MYKNKIHLHFVGIGGIGMSGIATILRHQGYIISGCDLNLDQQSVKNLINLGCTVFQGNNTESCHDTSIGVMVYSSAIQSSNPEIIAAQQRGIPTIPRALMLAELMRTKYSIAIGGSHGKTTTTSLISHILIAAEMDPTVIIGGHLKSISSNARFGEGDFLVAEADESDRSITHLHATIAVVTNINSEHLGTYKDLDDIKQTFLQFLNNIPFYGRAIVCIDDAQIRSLLPIPHLKTVTYGSGPDADFYAQNITLNPSTSTFTVFKKNSAIPLGTIEYAIPGKHNILNALAAIAVATDLGISFDSIAAALQSFKGVERRFSYRGVYKGAELFDDYANHPEEIYNTLLVAQKRTKKNLTIVFQPHRYTRLSTLWYEFIDLFMKNPIHHLVITDVYSAFESPIANATGKNLADAIIQCNPSFPVSYIPYEPTHVQLHKKLDEVINKDDLVLFVGAGSINKLAHALAALDHTPITTKIQQL
ncbi:MAG TPA: UDP-N-acetylmuramate--L-alanine ligase [Candidatus Babeliales bacterium]|nr:UDP-N-acetylmuramate--L-alanine ligase [Candidatus Babeliales bacterium]